MKVNLIKMTLLTLIISMFVACGGKKENANIKEENTATLGEELKPEEGSELLVWESSGADLEFMKSAAKEFQKKYPNVKFKFEEKAPKQR